MNESLWLPGNYVIWSPCIRFPGHKGQNPTERAEIKSYYVRKLTKETLAHKSIYDHLTRMATVDKIINANASKAPREAKN